MQYQSDLNRNGLIDLAINKYFANVDKKELGAVLECFHDNAIITIQTAFASHVGIENIERMFIDFMGAYDTIVHRDFTCTVDEVNGRIAANFVAELTTADGNKTVLENTNFWRVRGDKFQEVYIYMSGENPLV